MGVAGALSPPPDSAKMKVSVCLVALLSAVLSSGVEAGVLSAQEAGTSLAPSWLTSLAPVERFDAFFETVDRWLWDSEDQEGRMYRRGYMRMRRPRFLTTYNTYTRRQEPTSMYRSFVDTCYGIGCWLGINGLMEDIARLG